MLGLLLAVAEQSRTARRALEREDWDALLGGIARGDEAAFEAFYRASDKLIYAYALSLTRSHEDAQDVMMETYLSIRTGAGRYRSQGKPLAWVFTVAKNAARSLQRAGAREELMAEPPETALPAWTADGSDDALALRAAMEVLDEQERQIVVLHAVSGMKHRELAGLTGLPLSTVLSKYTRALAKLRRALTQGEVTV